MKESKKVIRDLISRESRYIGGLSPGIRAYNDGMTIPNDIYQIGNVKVHKYKLDGFFSFEAITEIFPSFKIVYSDLPLIDNVNIFIMEVMPGVRATGILSVNTYGTESLSSTERTYIQNSYLNRTLDELGMRDLIIAYPVDDLENASIRIEKLLEKKSVKDNSVKEDAYKLGLVVYSNNRLDIMVKTIKFDSQYEDLDKLYNSIDAEFHDTLIDKIFTTSKGNIVFNGPPGTGKSFYIRKLIKDYYIKHESAKSAPDDDDDEDSYYDRLVGRLGKNMDKLFVYIPSNLSHLFSDPTFTSMLQDKASEYPKGLVIILEDAEKVIGSRDGVNGGDGVSALLNMSDGILNDIISTQFIFTYNTDTENIDSAILRPGRLMAKKTFGLLPDWKATELADLIGVDKFYDEDTSIATVFSELQEKQNSILIEEEENTNKIGF